MKRTTTTAYSNDPERFHSSILFAVWKGWPTSDLIKLAVEADQEMKYHAQQQAMVDWFRRTGFWTPLCPPDCTPYV